VPIIYFDKVLHNSYGHKFLIPSAEAAKIATSKLLQQIKKKNKIVYGLFDDERLAITEDRILGYKLALAENNIHLDNQHCFFVSDALGAEELLLNWFATGKKPDGLFVMSDEILAGVVAALKKLRLSVPEDINIVAISDGYFSKFSSYKIPYIETSGYDLGKKATELLFEIIKNPNIAVEEHYIEAKYTNV
jgi:LacI family transcriptional regulator